MATSPASSPPAGPGWRARTATPPRPGTRTTAGSCRGSNTRPRPHATGGTPATARPGWPGSSRHPAELQDLGQHQEHDAPAVEVDRGEPGRGLREGLAHGPGIIPAPVTPSKAAGRLGLAGVETDRDGRWTRPLLNRQAPTAHATRRDQVRHEQESRRQPDHLGRRRLPRRDRVRRQHLRDPRRQHVAPSPAPVRPGQEGGAEIGPVPPRQVALGHPRRINGGRPRTLSRPPR